MKVFGITGTFRCEIKAEDEDDALMKFDDLKVNDLNRVDVNDIMEY